MKYEWDIRRQAYVDERSRVVTSRSLHALLNIIIGKVSGRFAEIEDDRASGRISNEEAQRRGQREIGLSNRVMSALGWGGLRNIPEGARSAADSKVRLEMAFWLRFQSDRPQLSPDQARARATLYAGGAYRAFQDASREAHRQAGFNEARRVLEAGAEHCAPGSGRPGCPELAARGWMPVSEMVPIGDASCRASCLCEMQYRRSEEAA